MTTASDRQSAPHTTRGEGAARRLYHSRLTPEWFRQAYRRFRRRPVVERRQDTRPVSAPPSPGGFGDKVRHKIANDRRPLLTTFADKVAVRDYVAATVGAEFLTELYLVSDDPQSLQPGALPREFAVKASHGSGAVVVVSDRAGPDTDLPCPPAGWPRVMIKPERLDWGRLRALASEWLELRYRATEWAYRDVPPRLLAEELLLEDGHVPPDHRVFVFHGRARLVQIDQGRFVDHTQVFYTPEWERLEAQFGRPRGQDAPRPPRLADMLDAAEALGHTTDFLRVDFYSLGTRLVVGELTNYPMGGSIGFTPEAVDRQLGSWWMLPRLYTHDEITRVARAMALES